MPAPPLDEELELLEEDEELELEELDELLLDEDEVLEVELLLVVVLPVPEELLEEAVAPLDELEELEELEEELLLVGLSPQQVGAIKLPS